jgi:hypothetical protein
MQVRKTVTGALVVLSLDHHHHLAPFERSGGFRIRHGRAHELLAELVGGQGCTPLQRVFGFSVFRFKNSKRPILSKQRRAS